jgi:cobalt/nickel transport system permease protein
VDFEKWANGDSVFHRASPQIKIAGAVCFCFGVAACQQMQSVAAGLVFACVGVLFTGIPLAGLLKRLFFVNLFTAVCWLTLPVTVTGRPVAHLGFLVISREGIDMALLITIKTNCLVLAFVTLLSTSSVADLGHGLRHLKIPQKLCLLLLFSYRYIFVIYDEYKRLKRAALFRSFKPTTSMHTYQTYGNLFGMTLVKGWQRAGRVQDAMYLRGFSGRFISLDYENIRFTDWLLLGILLCGTGFVIFLEYYGVML